MSDELNGSLTITYPTGYSENTVCISLVDALSGKPINEIRISYAEFTSALSSKYGRPCIYRLTNIDKAGKKHETCSHHIPKRYFHRRPEDIAELQAACAEYEVDGWVADIQTALNSQQGPNSTCVHFHRYVEQ